MIIATSVFGDGFGRLLKAHKRSIEANCPDAEHRIYWGDGPVSENYELPFHCTSNTIKLQHWQHAAHQADDDLVLMDADTIVLGDLSDAFGDWDIGITVRPGRYPINGGVVFVRPTAAARYFLDLWRAYNDRLYSGTTLASHAVDVYGGLNQSSIMHALLECPEARVAQLPCEVWNCVDETWPDFGPHTRVLHMKGKLRILALEDVVIEEDVPVERCLQAWRRYGCDAVDSAAAVG